MTDWTAGYVADIGYTYGYYAELNPLRARLCLLNVALVPPSTGVHCELGFGQGLSTNIHAAATGATWYGTDFNPAQAAFAQELAAASGADIHIYDQAFADFCRREDLPDFDSIGLHGIWSWVSDENRAVIADFIRRKLKVGGVVYVSYNTLPGWASFVPMRHLLVEHAEIIGAEGRGTAGRIERAMAFADRFMATNPAFARANPFIAERFNSLRASSASYLAHEYFNRDWEPMHFSRMAKWLEPAKVSFACSAQIIEHFDFANLTAEQQALMNEIPDQMFRQSVRDFMVNQQFRRDYWVKGARRLSGLEHQDALRQLRVVLVAPRELIPLTIQGGVGEMTLNEELYSSILDLLADHKARSFADIEKELGWPLTKFAQAIMLLCSTGRVSIAQDADKGAKAAAACHKLNRHIMQKSRTSTDLAYLASPVTGEGCQVTRLHQLFLLAMESGKTKVPDLARYAWDILQSQGQRLSKAGLELQDPDDNLAELEEIAKSFTDKSLKVLKALQIA